MCGIIGIVSRKNIVPDVLEGLKRLEYRGYDSAGIAVINNNTLQRQRAEGKLSALENKLEKTPLIGAIGIGHTRWATHGAPNEKNAHPHMTENVAVVHNGIIENNKVLRKELEALGYQFSSDTDTEVIPCFITHHLKQGNTPREAVHLTLKKLQGAFALAIIFNGDENLLIGARQGSPLVVGYGHNEMYLGSDAYALSPLTTNLTYLEEGDVAELSQEHIKIFDKDDNPVHRNIHLTALSDTSVGKGNYRHYMLKEIHQQPEVMDKTFTAYYDETKEQISLPPLSFDLATVSKITIIACGTSYYAGLVAKYWFEDIAHIPVEVDIASEFRYRNAILPENGVALFISQSGETADTLAALRFAKQQKQHIISIINAKESSMERESDLVLPSHAGPEIGVASTKAYTTQLVVLACLVLACAEARRVNHVDIKELTKALLQLPERSAEILAQNDTIEWLARDMAQANDALYIGRGTSYATALEGALKLKELSYIHAEGIAAGELKHGPIALIDEHIPVVVIAPYDRLFEKTISNVEEVVTRGGRVIFISDEDGAAHAQGIAMDVVILPKVNPFIAPMLYVIPMQLLAYHIAVFKGTDVDQPRNLAKSVTVE